MQTVELLLVVTAARCCIDTGSVSVTTAEGRVRYDLSCADGATLRPDAHARKESSTARGNPMLRDIAMAARRYSLIMIAPTHRG